MSATEQSNLAKTVLRLSFIGPEFLTWVYFYIYDKGGELMLPLLNGAETSNTNIRAAIGKKISLRPPYVEGSRVNIMSPRLDDSGEVLQAVRNGCMVDTLSLEIFISERVYSFTLNSVDGSLSQVKLDFGFDKDEDLEFEEGSFGGSARVSKDESKEMQEEENLLLRMSALDEVEEIVNGLLAIFLKKRLEPTFVTKEIAKIRMRVAHGLEAAIPRTISLPNEAKQDILYAQ